MRKISSPGLDGIDYTIIVALPTNAKSLLLNILNRIFITHTFPDEWRKYLVFFIPKQDDTKFRPISLASCIFKILERLIANRLNWFLEHYNLLPNSQFGFRRNRGCIDNLAILHSNILLGFQDDSSTLVSFLDIKAAYDNVISDILLNKLKGLGVSPNIFAFISNSIRQRQVYCRFEEIDEIYWAFKGLLQGSVLSPMLYNIYVSNIGKCCENDCKIIQYADDIAIFHTFKEPANGRLPMEKSINRVSNFLFHIGLDLSIEKPKYVNFLNVHLLITILT